MKNSDGNGFVLYNTSGALIFKIKCLGTGSLTIALRGIDEKRLDMERRPVYICFTNLEVDNTKIFAHDTYVCHDLPFIYRMEVKDKQEITLNLSWNTIKTITDICSLPVSCEDNNFDYLIKKDQILESRIAALELEISSLKSIINSKNQIEKIMDEYRGKIWDLKKYIQEMTDFVKRNDYIRAYDGILREYSSWIGWNSKIDGIPCFPHGFHGIFISGGAKIGKNAVIFQHVTIGSNTIEGSKRNGSPTIGDNCYIGAGAKIIGRITIGNNCRIGANAVVTIDVPDDSVVVMEKPRILHKEGMDNKYYNIKNGVKVYHLGDKIFPVE